MENVGTISELEKYYLSKFKPEFKDVFPKIPNEMIWFVRSFIDVNKHIYEPDHVSLTSRYADLTRMHFYTFLMTSKCKEEVEIFKRKYIRLKKLKEIIES